MPKYLKCSRPCLWFFRMAWTCGSMSNMPLKTTWEEKWIDWKFSDTLRPTHTRKEEWVAYFEPFFLTCMSFSMSGIFFPYCTLGGGFMRCLWCHISETIAWAAQPERRYNYERWVNLTKHFECYHLVCINQVSFDSLSIIWLCSINEPCPCRNWKWKVKTEMFVGVKTHMLKMEENTKGWY